MTSDMQTHKNSKLRDISGPPVAPKPKHGLTGSSSVGPSISIRSPKFELEGKKWVIEYHRNNPNLSIKNPDMSQSVYIFQCEASSVTIDGKVNNVVVDGCKKTSIVFSDVVSSCQFVNCQSVQMQVCGLEVRIRLGQNGQFRSDNNLRLFCLTRCKSLKSGTGAL